MLCQRCLISWSPLYSLSHDLRGQNFFCKKTSDHNVCLTDLRILEVGYSSHLGIVVVIIVALSLPIVSIASLSSVILTSLRSAWMPLDVHLARGISIDTLESTLFSLAHTATHYFTLILFIVL